mgnify:CR=1 FL=1
MSKAEFIAHVAQAGDLTNAEAKRMVELVFGEIENGLKRARKDGKYTIGTFGTFTISKRPARTGRNPRTGEIIYVPARRKTHFKPGRLLKDAPHEVRGAEYDSAGDVSSDVERAVSEHS